MKVEGQDFLLNRSCFFGSFVLGWGGGWGGVLLYYFIFVLHCYMVKKCQLEKVQKHFSLTRGTLHCVLFITDGAIARVFLRTPPMKHHLQTWRYFHRLFHLIRFQQCIPCSLHECTRMGQTLCYHYMVAIHVSPAQRGSPVTTNQRH